MRPSQNQVQFGEGGQRNWGVRFSFLLEDGVASPPEGCLPLLVFLF